MQRKGLTVFGAVSVLGMIGVALAVLLGFEEPPAGLLLASAICMFAGPAALVADIALTKSLTRRQKRIWFRALAGPRAPHAISAYLKHSR